MYWPHILASGVIESEMEVPILTDMYISVLPMNKEFLILTYHLYIRPAGKAKLLEVTSHTTEKKKAIGLFVNVGEICLLAWIEKVKILFLIFL